MNHKKKILIQEGTFAYRPSHANLIPSNLVSKMSDI